MKKLISVFLILACLFSLVACGAKGLDTSAAGKIAYGEKYIFERSADAAEDEQIYYLFQKDTMTYHRYSEHEGTVLHYTVTYKYTVVDEGSIACFFDSVEVHADHNGESPELQSDAFILLVSENVVCKTDQSLYIREGYLERELTNFRKEAK